MHSWHPLTIHLPLIALPLAAAFDLISSARRDSGWRPADTLLWWFGLAAGAVAVFTGLVAYDRVDDSDPAHEVMTLHRNLALATMAVLALAALWRWRRPLSRAAAALALAGAGLLGVVGFPGGELVYDHGIGLSNDRMRGILTERGVAPLAPPDAAGHEQAHDPAFGTDSAAAKPRGHTHPPGQEH